LPVGAEAQAAGSIVNAVDLGAEPGGPHGDGPHPVLAPEGST
jgi:hypothetical protein